MWIILVEQFDRPELPRGVQEHVLVLDHRVVVQLCTVVDQHRALQEMLLRLDLLGMTKITR